MVMVTSQHSQIITSVIALMKVNIELSKSNAISIFPDYKESIQDSFYDLENSIAQVESVISNNFSDGSIKSLKPNFYTTFISYFDEVLNDIHKTMDRVAFKNINVSDTAIAINMDFYEIQDAKFAFVDLYNQIHWPK